MIEKLKDYKATLINSAVTGKIKVLDPTENKVNESETTYLGARTSRI